jgi:AcrR family transcriptional regulator
MRRLPRGRHGLSREFVAQDQRGRLLVAVADALHERGYDRTTVSSIGTRAHVSKSDFYRHFASKDECFVAAYDEAVEDLRVEMLAACAKQSGWAEGVCAGLAGALAWLAREPARANLLLVEGLRTGGEIYDRFLAALDSFVPPLRASAPSRAVKVRPPQAADEAVVGGVVSLMAQRVLAGETEQMERFFPDIAEFALTPYLGAAASRRIISTR